MRMRHKKNLRSRSEACGDYMIYLEPQVLDDREEDPSAQRFDLEAMFGGRTRIEAEIGCGKGAFACECAALEPQTGLIAVEALENVIVAGTERAVREGLENVRFVCVGAQYLWRYLPENSVSRLYLNFSCPYPKSGHEGKRLTSPHFLDIYKRFLAPDGEIWQKTDNREFFDYSLEQLRAAGYELRNLTYDLHGDGSDASLDPRANIITEYERRFMNEGKPICRVEAYPTGR